MTDPHETFDLTIHEQPTSPTTVVDLIRLAIQQGIPVEALEKLQALHERVSDREAAREFNEALSRFQSQVGPISRNKTANIVTEQGGTRFSYKYAELDHIDRKIKKPLQDNGFAYSWDTKVDDRFMHITCTLRHVNGHRETSTFTCPTESKAGMTAQQKFAAALTFGKRQSLTQVLGLTTTDQDTDGGDPTPISEEQASDLEAMVQESGMSIPKYLKWLGVPRISDIRSDQYDAIVRQTRVAVEERKKKAQS